MTDTGQVPGEGLPENAGMVDQPGVPAPGAYTYLSETTAEDEDLLLLPGAQSAWGNEVAPPAPEPVVEALHEPGAHEMSGRDSGAVDLSAVRMPGPAPVPPTAPRRPLHLGPPTPDASASPVRSLADRGAVGAPPVRQPGPPTAGPEYLDIQGPQPAAPWGVPAPAQESAEVSAAETVVPSPAPAPEPADAAQAAMASLATETVAVAQPVEGAEFGHAAQPMEGPELGHSAQEPQGVEPTPVPAPEEAEAGPVPVTPIVAEASVPAEQFPVAGGDSGAGFEGVQAVEPVAEAVPLVEPVAAPEVAQDAEAAAPTADQAADAVQIPVVPDPEPVAVPEPPVTELVAPEAPAVVEAAVPEPAPQPEPAAPVVAEAPVLAEPEPLAAAVEEPPAPEAPQVEPVPASEVPAPDLAPEAPAPEPAPEALAAPTLFVAAPAEPPAEPAVPVVAEAPAAEAPAITPEPALQPERLEAQPVPLAPEEPEAPAPQPYVADPAGPQMQTPEAGVLMESQPEQPLGQFVPVEGQVPTTPHLAPTPPQPIVLPAEEPLSVPAPRAGDPEPVQHAEDLDTRAAEQEESTAAVAEARQSTGPAAPAYDDAEREAVLKVMRERRDIRNGFRGDPIPHEVLLRVLEAAHTAPSVGHSQPWDFVVIRSAETRRTMHELAMRQRDAYAKSLPKGRAKQFKELKIEAILDTPVNIVVTADPTRGGRHTLGRHTQPQMAPYSSALAVENLWLAARAEGLGVGWVSFFDEREMVRTLGLPDHLEVVAYLCVGYVDEFPDEPELMQAGWSKRRPLSWVVHEETYGRRALPGEDPHDLLAETVSQIRPLDAKALGEAWERQKRMTKPAGALGMLEIISAQLSGLSRQCPPPIPEPAAVAIFAGDHGVHAQGVTPWPQEVTAQMVANFLGGGAVCNAFAGQVGAEVCVVDVGVAADLPATPGLLPRKVRAGTSDMTTGPAMTREEAKQAIEVGIETARDLVAAGNKALLTGEMGIANTTASAALISVFTGVDPAEVTGRGTGINDETLARKTEVVRRALEVHQPDPADPIGVLAAIGGFEHAAMVGLLLGGASLRTPVILDGVSAGAAALVARAIAPEVLAACIAGHRSAEPGHVAALNKLGLRPLVDLDLRLGEGTGALLALPLVQSTARAMHEVATFDSAGVTEK
ncbi:nicotinate-nucleotide--dimethylbenzimidazole phosphoribosyltransferase [Streptomyces sp. NBC_00287]|uniref:nicotinate-nucleotide--dimethylbenzimidazole phosphoribosyltransferase n=1 Tax=Streptomyces sp. NBC_00287 TaxID=2975702 RepID=UPI002E293754|nr:nicotinate-nucleotide--dimethylbenzimidazole phosphoribosyltransferase [Streptomyces sp. NBC_00287]